MKNLLNKLFPRKIWAVAAAKTTSRGVCYTLLVGRFLPFAYPAGMMYEKNKDGSPNEEMKKVIIL